MMNLQESWCMSNKLKSSFCSLTFITGLWDCPLLQEWWNIKCYWMAADENDAIFSFSSFLILVIPQSYSTYSTLLEKFWGILVYICDLRQTSFFQAHLIICATLGAPLGSGGIGASPPPGAAGTRAPPPTVDTLYSIIVSKHWQCAMPKTLKSNLYCAQFTQYSTVLYISKYLIKSKTP